MIPHIIHFTVPRQMSAAQEDAIRIAREKNPDWELRVWQDPVSINGFRLAPLWSNANSGAQLADLIRLDAVSNYGGVYLDSDVTIHRPLTPIADHCEFFVCSEDGGVATNAVFGARRGHGALEALIGDLLKSPPDWSLPPNVTTGPEFFARILKWRRDVTVLPRATFYPYSWDEKPTTPHPSTYGVHRWMNSWNSPVKEALRIKPHRLLRRCVSGLRSKANASEWWIRRRKPRLEGFPAAGELVRRTIHGHSIVLAGEDLSVTPEIYMNGYYELRDELFVKRVVRGGDYFIDVGANAGVFSLLAASKVGPFGRVFSYEPNPRMCDLLRKSTTMNWMHDRMKILPSAVGSSQGMARLLVSSSRLGDAALKADEEGAPSRTRESLKEVESFDVAVVALDDEFPFDIPVRVLKIDAEGFEAEVLRGADRLFRNQCIDFALVEAVEEVSGTGWSAFLSALQRLETYGYHPNFLMRDGILRKTTIDQVRISGGQGSRNIVLKRDGAVY